MDGQDTSRKGRYALIASLASSLLIAIIFVILSLAVNSSRTVPLYSPVDIVAGMVFVFVLSMIVSASVWPGIFEKGLH
ncbi:MAG: hypothetical protein JW705_02940 [Methanosarcinaceae archaeon]|nr:hypothetical protein [Methanosarcinaceae archaeon]